MLRNLGRFVPALLPQTQLQAATATRSFRAVADVEIDFNDRETLKQYVGVRGHLSKEPATKGKFMEALNELLKAVSVLPPSGYRQAVEATANYRLKVCTENTSDAAVEEVLDAHLEELIKECKEEQRLLPLFQESKPWDVSEEYTVPVVTYHDASEFLNAPKK